MLGDITWWELSLSSAILAAPEPAHHAALAERVRAGLGKPLQRLVRRPIPRSVRAGRNGLVLGAQPRLHASLAVQFRLHRQRVPQRAEAVG